MIYRQVLLNRFILRNTFKQSSNEYGIGIIHKQKNEVSFSSVPLIIHLGTMHVFKVASNELKDLLCCSNSINVLHNFMHIYVMNIVVYSC